MLILPELALNIFGTIWAFCNLIKCTADEQFTKTAVEGKYLNNPIRINYRTCIYLRGLIIYFIFAVIVLFNWVIFALIVFGMAIVFDPMGSTKYRAKSSADNCGPAESVLHRKVSQLWLVTIL